MTNKEAIAVLLKSSWMCLSHNIDEFQQAMEVALNNLLKNERERLKNEMSNKVKTEELEESGNE